jgi:hypothetical protein
MAEDVTKIVQERHKQRQERMLQFRASTRTPMVRVVPTKPEYRKHLKHGLTGVGFLEEGPAEWPNDQFTQRRIREGAIKLEDVKREDVKQEDVKQEEPKRIRQPSTIS